MNEPVRRNPNDVPIAVTIGKIALRKAWVVYSRNEGTPLATASLMNSWRNVSIMLTLLIAIWSFGRAFTIIFLLTEGGPAGCTETIVVRSYLEAFKFFHVGTASALGVMVLAISLVFSIGYLAVAYRRDGRHA